MTLRKVDAGWDLDVSQFASCKVRYQDNLLDADPNELLDPDPDDLAHGHEPPSQRLAVIDAEVWRQYHQPITRWLSNLSSPTTVMPVFASEATKTAAAVDQIVNMAQALGLKRRDEFLAIGGGIILDQVGVAAATLRKGTPYSVVPTTLVGKIDAGPAGKRAVNHGGRKNTFGAYHIARRVLLDHAWLLTNDSRHLRAGAAESIKVGEMVDPYLLSLWEEHGEDLIESKFDHPVAQEVLDRSLGPVLEHIAADMRERNLRRWLDHGHTLSPELEMQTHGGLVHGEAVSLCSRVSAVLAAQGGYVDADYPTRMVDLARTLSLPTYHPLLDDPVFLSTAVAGAVSTRNGHQHWPIVTRLGEGEGPAGCHTFLEDVTADQLIAATAGLRRLTAAA